MSDSHTRARDILAARARELARPVAGVARDGAVSALLVVRIADDRAGIALDHIIEVHRPTALTPIPGARAPVIGAIAWRGRVLTILDIASARRTSLAISDSTRVVVLGQRRAAFGVVVDEVENVEDVNMHDTAMVADLAPARRDLVRGVTSDAVVVLDAAALIARFAPTH